LLDPGHVSTTFLQSLQHPAGLAPADNFISATKLVQDCPCSLLTTLADNHPDQKTWLESYFEEKRTIEALDTYKRLTLAEYHSL
jgi:hypothetical protein